MTIATLDETMGESGCYELDDKLRRLIGAKIERIIYRDDEDNSEYPTDYCNYELLVVTASGVLQFAGCHDAGGNAVFKDSIP